MNILRRTTILSLALAAGAILFASPALALSKADRVVLGKINTRAQAFLGAVQANQTAALQVKGQWVARTQENNKACQNALLDINEKNQDNQIYYLPLAMYGLGKSMAVNHTIKAQWVNYLKSFEEISYPVGTSRTFRDSFDSYRREIAAESIAWPILFKNMYTVDQLCDAAESWDAAGATEANAPQLFKDIIQDSLWLNLTGNNGDGWDLASMLRKVKAPSAVIKLVRDGYTGIPIWSYDPVLKESKYL